MKVAMVQMVSGAEVAANLERAADLVAQAGALGAELVVLSTPFGKRGWFFELWDAPDRLGRFHAHKVTAADCPRITPAFLAEERVELGERWFRQEWYCSFEDAVDAVFSGSLIEAARADGIDPLF